MSRTPEELAALSPLKRALLALTDMEARLEAATRAQKEPIAIVGIGCRFPGGAEGPSEFWRLLRDGGDAISEVPPDRWDVDAYYDPDPAAPGKMSTRWGGFLRHVDEFDAGFFGISPREALWMDPQQRLLLEVAWEALEDAGQTAGEWSERPAGVFVGVSSSDYVWQQFAASGELDAYTSTGIAYSIIANRLSYLLDLKGPSLAVDTACSSSLVAVHLACHSLRQHECHLALAGGVNLVLSPVGTISLSKFGMMAPDGRCKAFDAAADGFVRGEGCGIVVLKRLSDALAAGDAIRAVIRGSAVNQDGRSNGLTAPNGASQQAVVRQALAQAGVLGEELQYIEAHGTGTSLGDPIETEALKTVLGQPRDGRACVVGSVKANIGHLEAAAGIAGLIKVVLALDHETIPPQAHFRTLNPHIDLTNSPLVIAAGGRPWRRGARPRLAGVSSFGFGGTNAHAVVEEPPEQGNAAEGAGSTGRAYLLPLSARNSKALAALASAYRERLAGQGLLLDICYTASVRRNHHPRRLAVVGRSTAELADRLQGLAPVESPRAGSTLGPVFIFGGQGEQWPGMGQGLLAEERVFREALEEYEAALGPHVPWSFFDELRAGDARSRLAETEIAQPVLLGLQVGLARLWRSWGIEPAAVAGHSVGEVAAAHVAGALDLTDAVRVAVHRGRLMQRARGKGAMLAVEMAPEDALRTLDHHAGAVTIAALNGPAATVLSGDGGALGAIAVSLRTRGIGCQELKAPYAFHHPSLAPLGAELREILDGLGPRSATLPVVSTLTGRSCEGRELDAGYWGRQLCEPVRFAAAVAVLSDQGHEVFLELSPHPVLGGAVTQCLTARTRPGVALASLRRNRAERDAMLASLGRLYELGYSVAWSRLYPDGGHGVPLPAYPWQHERFWPANGGKRPPVAGKPVRAHPLLGEYMQAADTGTHCWQTDLGRATCPYLDDHRLQGAMVLPAAAALEMALAASAEALGAGPHALEDIVFSRVMALPEGNPQPVQLAISAEPAGSAKFQLLSRTAGVWTLHASGTIRRGTDALPHGSAAAIRAGCLEVIEGAEHYRVLREQGLEYGPAFQAVQRIWRRDGEAIGRLGLSPPVARDAPAYQVHPVLLDAGFQVLAAAVPRAQARLAAGAIYLPVRLATLRVHPRPRERADLWGHVLVRAGAGAAADAFEGDLFVIDSDGQVLIEALGLRVGRLTPARSTSADSPSDWFYEVRWQAKTLRRDAAPVRRGQRWLILSDSGGVGSAVARLLEARGERCVTAPVDEGSPAGPEELRRWLHEAFAEAPPRGLIHLRSVDAVATEPLTLDSIRSAQDLGCRSVLHLVQAVGRVGWRQAPRLWVITRGAHAPAPAPAPLSLAQSPLLGLRRVIALEHPELHCTEVDLGPEGSAEEIASLVEELVADDDETQVALRDGVRYVARLARWVPEPAPDTQTLAPAEGRAFRLEIDEPGTLDRMGLRAVARRPPGPGEVEIQVAAAGLNFNDVLKALGLYPGVAPGPVPLGSECAGAIATLGSRVDGLVVGQHVVALAEASFGAFATTSALMVAPAPPNLTLEQAATLPVVFMTAVYGLRHLARLARGERVLIHAAAGGVGLAALQVAQRVGAEIFATAGSPEKRALLESLGVPHVMDSRSLAFADDVMARTDGGGVDVVLNSLAGEAMLRSLDVMAPYGRFVELGKRDIHENRRVGLWPFRKAVAYLPLDLAGLVHARPVHFHSLWREVMEEIAAGVWQPLPHRVFPVHEAASAFRLMAQGKHVGKVVLSVPDPVRVLVAPAVDTAAAFRADGTYLITGGLGGLGLQVARWMVDRGARHLALIGRRGPSEAARGVLCALEQAGARVLVIQADVSVPSQLAAALADIERDLPALRGIIHAAGVLDDGLLLQQDWERFAKVMAPKAEGAWNLHALTLGRRLDFFVMFSSMAAVVGSPGQGSYAAANAFLDSLAGHRRAQGLPGLSINWGPWVEVGMAAGRPGVSERMQSMGVGTITPHAGLQALERILRHPVTQIGVIPITWRDFPAGTPSMPLLADLIQSETRGHAAGSREGRRSQLRASLFAASAEERPAILDDYLRQQLARVLGAPVSSLDDQQPLSALGVDSLMAVELRTRIQTDLRVVVPIASVLAGPSLRQVCTLLLELLTAQWLAEAPRRNGAASEAGEWEVLTI